MSDDIARWQYLLQKLPIIIDTKVQNGYAILYFENPYWVWFLIPKEVQRFVSPPQIRTSPD
jgi:hypothetical protein